MSLRAIVEIVIHIESFRNIDLFHQGIQQIKSSIRHENEQQRFYACPYSIYNASISSLPTKKTKKSKAFDHHSLIPAHVLDHEQSFCSRAFLIRQCEEEVEINDIGHFRTEIEVVPGFLNQPFILDVELMFSDVNKMGVTERIAERFNKLETKCEFKSVSNVSFKIDSLAKGLNDYCSIVFDESHFCMANMTIHAVLLDFRFRLTSMQSSSNLRNNENKNLQRSQSAVIKNKDGPSSVAHFLFKDEDEEQTQTDIKNVSTETANNVHNRFISTLSLAQNNLTTNFNLISTRCLTSTQKQALGDEQFEIPNIKIFINNFTDRVGSNIASKLAQSLLLEVNTIAGQIFQLWHKLLEVVTLAPKATCQLFAKNYWNSIRERVGESIFKDVVLTKDFAAPHPESNIGDSHKNIAKSWRSKLQQKTRDPLRIEEIGGWPAPEQHPIIFEEVYVKDKAAAKKDVGNITSDLDIDDNASISTLSSNQEESLNSFLEQHANLSLKSILEEKQSEPKGIHLFIMVHGFQGNSYDMRLLRNHLAVHHPEALFLCSSSNEDQTEGDISEMGVRLAQEVTLFINEWCPGSALGRISFLGFSLGGIIIRAALPYMKQQRRQMWLFMTFSSPHLGFMYNNSKIVDTGIWLLKKFKKSKSLCQLSLTDAKEYEDTLLQRLSQSDGMIWFKNIALVSSWQDTYSPFDSSRIEICTKAANDNVRGSIQIKMARNILSNCPIDSIQRIDVNFKINEKNIDSMIGRAAHIQFLENQALIKMFVNRYQLFFN